MLANIPNNIEFEKCLKENDLTFSLIEPVDIEYVSDFKMKETSDVFYYIPKMYKKYDFVVSFDLDWTLSYGEKGLYPSQPEDIQILPNRREILVSLVKKGYTLAIFTNQKGRSRQEKLKKVERVRTFLQKIRLPIYTFISVSEGESRKPNIGMYTLFQQYINPQVLYFIGDALGRPQDFSDSDKIFGERINAIVLSPEEFFPPTNVPKFKSAKELIIFVGAQGTGKSTFARNNYKDFIIINQDTLKTKAKVMKVLEESLKTSRSIIIDSTNPSLENHRKPLYAFAEKYNYHVNVLYFIRNGYGWNEIRKERVPTISYHVFYKNLDSPLTFDTDKNVFQVWF